LCFNDTSTSVPRHVSTYARYFKIIYTHNETRPYKSNTLMTKFVQAGARSQLNSTTTETRVAIVKTHLLK